jgi:hypothetical protein
VAGGSGLRRDFDALAERGLESFNNRSIRCFNVFFTVERDVYLVRGDNLYAYRELRHVMFGEVPDKTASDLTDGVDHPGRILDGLIKVNDSIFIAAFYYKPESVLCADTA